MSFKKSFKRGQAALEYFILFSMIAMLTILSLSTLHPKVKESLQGAAGRDGFFQVAFERLTR